jgi:hypothetical protein
VWWLSPLTQAQKQTDLCELEDSLVYLYIANTRTAKAAKETLSPKKKKKKKKTKNPTKLMLQFKKKFYVAPTTLKLIM